MMKRGFIVFLLFSLLLAACDFVIPPAVNDPTQAPPTETSIPPTVTWTATQEPSPTLVFTPTLVPVDTATALPPEADTPTPIGDCNAAELVAQGYAVESGGPLSPGAEFDLILRLTNVGLCTWTNEYLVTLIENEDLYPADPQYFEVTAVPGQTVDLPISLTVPEESGSYYAAWKLQDPLGEVFGYGPDGSQSFTLAISVTGGTAAMAINEPLFAGEVCGSQGTQTGLPRYARLMHDPQWMPWPSRLQDPEWRKGFYYDWYPETVQLWTNPKGGDGRFAYSKAWLEYLRAIQPNDDAAVWIARVGAGLFNKGNEFIPILDLGQLKEEPTAESISSGGNVVRVLEIANQAGRLDMLYSKDTPPNAYTVNYQTRPWLVTKFTAVSYDGDLGNPGGIDVYFPNLAKQPEGYWVEMQRVEMFPALPFCATVTERLIVHTSPDQVSEQLGVLLPEQPVVIREYMPQGGLVWGRINGGWILIEYQKYGWPVYPTTWSMETRPPMSLP